MDEQQIVCATPLPPTRLSHPTPFHERYKMSNLSVFLLQYIKQIPEIWSLKSDFTVHVTLESPISQKYIKIFQI